MHMLKLSPPFKPFVYTVCPPPASAASSVQHPAAPQNYQLRISFDQESDLISNVKIKIQTNYRPASCNYSKDRAHQLSPNHHSFAGAANFSNSPSNTLASQGGKNCTTAGYYPFSPSHRYIPKFYLHWGLKFTPNQTEWTQPPPAWVPPNSLAPTSSSECYVQTPFTPSTKGESEVVISFGHASALPYSLNFVLFTPDGYVKTLNENDFCFNIKTIIAEQELSLVRESLLMRSPEICRVVDLPSSSYDPSAHPQLQMFIWNNDENLDVDISTNLIEDVVLYWGLTDPEKEGREGMCWIIPDVRLWPTNTRYSSRCSAGGSGGTGNGVSSGVGVVCAGDGGNSSCHYGAVETPFRRGEYGAFASNIQSVRLKLLKCASRRLVFVLKLLMGSDRVEWINHKGKDFVVDIPDLDFRNGGDDDHHDYDRSSSHVSRGLGGGGTIKRQAGGGNNALSGYRDSLVGVSKMTGGSSGMVGGAFRTSNNKLSRDSNVKKIRSMNSGKREGSWDTLGYDRQRISGMRRLSRTAGTTTMGDIANAFEIFHTLDGADGPLVRKGRTRERSSVKKSTTRDKKQESEGSREGDFAGALGGYGGNKWVGGASTSEDMYGLISSRIFSLDGGGVVEGIVRHDESSRNVKVNLRVSVDAEKGTGGGLICHWGIVLGEDTPSKRTWSLPPVDCWPAGSTPVDLASVDTPMRFDAIRGVFALDLCVPRAVMLPGAQQELSPVIGVIFVLNETLHSLWLHDAEDYDMFLKTHNDLPPVLSISGPLKSLVKRIVAFERSPTASWSLIKRHQLLQELLEDEDIPKFQTDYWVWLLVWLQYGELHGLNWRPHGLMQLQTLPSTSPLPSSSFQMYRRGSGKHPPQIVDHLALLLATYCREFDGHHQLIRMIVSSLVRSLIEIPIENRISGRPLVVGNDVEENGSSNEALSIFKRWRLTQDPFFKQWMKRMSCGTCTRDDIAICYAVIAFVKGGGCVEEFYRALDGFGLTADSLIQFDVPIRVPPSILPHLYCRGGWWTSSWSAEGCSSSNSAISANGGVTGSSYAFSSANGGAGSAMEAALSGSSSSGSAGSSGNNTVISHHRTHQPLHVSDVKNTMSSNNTSPRSRNVEGASYYSGGYDGRTSNDGCVSLVGAVLPVAAQESGAPERANHSLSSQDANTSRGPLGVVSERGGQYLVPPVSRFPESISSGLFAASSSSLSLTNVPALPLDTEVQNEGSIHGNEYINNSFVLHNLGFETSPESNLPLIDSKAFTEQPINCKNTANGRNSGRFVGGLYSGSSLSRHISSSVSVDPLPLNPSVSPQPTPSSSSTTPHAPVTPPHSTQEGFQPVNTQGKSSRSSTNTSYIPTNGPLLLELFELLNTLRSGYENSIMSYMKTYAVSLSSQHSSITDLINLIATDPAPSSLTQLERVVQARTLLCIPLTHHTDPYAVKDMMCLDAALEMLQQSIMDNLPLVKATTATSSQNNNSASSSGSNGHSVTPTHSINVSNTFAVFSTTSTIMPSSHGLPMLYSAPPLSAVHASTGHLQVNAPVNGCRSSCFSNSLPELVGGVLSSLMTLYPWMEDINAISNDWFSLGPFSPRVGVAPGKIKLNGKNEFWKFLSSILGRLRLCLERIVVLCVHKFKDKAIYLGKCVGGNEGIICRFSEMVLKRSIIFTVGQIIDGMESELRLEHPLATPYISWGIVCGPSNAKGVLVFFNRLQEINDLLEMLRADDKEAETCELQSYDGNPEEESSEKEGTINGEDFTSNSLTTEEKRDMLLFAGLSDYPMHNNLSSYDAALRRTKFPPGHSNSMSAYGNLLEANNGKEELKIADGRCEKAGSISYSWKDYGNLRKFSSKSGCGSTTESLLLSIPIIVAARSCTGMEELPENVTGVLVLSDSSPFPRTLSHVAFEARHREALLAVCFNSENFSQLQEFIGVKVEVRLHQNSSNLQVCILEDQQQGFFNEVFTKFGHSGMCGPMGGNAMEERTIDLFSQSPANNVCSSTTITPRVTHSGMSCVPSKMDNLSWGWPSFGVNGGIGFHDLDTVLNCGVNAPAGGRDEGFAVINQASGGSYSTGLHEASIARNILSGAPADGNSGNMSRKRREAPFISPVDSNAVAAHCVNMVDPASSCDIGPNQLHTEHFEAGKTAISSRCAPCAPAGKLPLLNGIPAWNEDGDLRVNFASCCDEGIPQQNRRMVFDGAQHTLESRIACDISMNEGDGGVKKDDYSPMPIAPESTLTSAGGGTVNGPLSMPLEYYVSAGKFAGENEGDLGMEKMGRLMQDVRGIQFCGDDANQVSASEEVPHASINSLNEVTEGYMEGEWAQVLPLWYTLSSPQSYYDGSRSRAASFVRMWKINRVKNDAAHNNFLYGNGEEAPIMPGIQREFSSDQGDRGGCLGGTHYTVTGNSMQFAHKRDQLENAHIQEAAAGGIRLEPKTLASEGNVRPEAAWRGTRGLSDDGVGWGGAAATVGYTPRCYQNDYPAQCVGGPVPSQLSMARMPRAHQKYPEPHGQHYPHEQSPHTQQLVEEDRNKSNFCYISPSAHPTSGMLSNSRGDPKFSHNYKNDSNISTKPQCGYLSNSYRTISSRKNAPKRNALFKLLPRLSSLLTKLLYEPYPKVPPKARKLLLRPSEFTPELVGLKAMSVASLEDSSLSCHLVLTFAMPFYGLDEALSIQENAFLAASFHKILLALENEEEEDDDSRVESLLNEARNILSELVSPPHLLKEFQMVCEPPANHIFKEILRNKEHKAWLCIKKVWCRQFTLPFWQVCKRAGLDIGRIRICVLIQEILPHESTFWVRKKGLHMGGWDSEEKPAVIGSKNLNGILPRPSGPSKADGCNETLQPNIAATCGPSRNIYSTVKVGGLKLEKSVLNSPPSADIRAIVKPFVPGGELKSEHYAEHSWNRRYNNSHISPSFLDAADNLTKKTLDGGQENSVIVTGEVWDQRGASEGGTMYLNPVAGPIFPNTSPFSFTPASFPPAASSLAAPYNNSINEGNTLRSDQAINSFPLPSRAVTTLENAVAHPPISAQAHALGELKATQNSQEEVIMKFPNHQAAQPKATECHTTSNSAALLQHHQANSDCLSSPSLPNFHQDSLMVELLPGFGLSQGCGDDPYLTSIGKPLLFEVTENACKSDLEVHSQGYPSIAEEKAAMGGSKNKLSTIPARPVAHQQENISREENNQTLGYRASSPAVCAPTTTSGARTPFQDRTGMVLSSFTTTVSDGELKASAASTISHAPLVEESSSFFSSLETEACGRKGDVDNTSQLLKEFQSDQEAVVNAGCGAIGQRSFVSSFSSPSPVFSSSVLSYQSSSEDPTLSKNGASSSTSSLELNCSLPEDFIRTDGGAKVEYKEFVHASHSSGDMEAEENKREDFSTATLNVSKVIDECIPRAMLASNNPPSSNSEFPASSSHSTISSASSLIASTYIAQAVDELLENMVFDDLQSSILKKPYQAYLQKFSRTNEMELQRKWSVFKEGNVDALIDSENDNYAKYYSPVTQYATLSVGASSEPRLLEKGGDNSYASQPGVKASPVHCKEAKQTLSPSLQGQITSSSRNSTKETQALSEGIFGLPNKQPNLRLPEFTSQSVQNPDSSLGCATSVASSSPASSSECQISHTGVNKGAVPLSNLSVPIPPFVPLFEGSIAKDSLIAQCVSSKLPDLRENGKSSPLQNSEETPFMKSQNQQLPSSQHYTGEVSHVCQEKATKRGDTIGEMRISGFEPPLIARDLSSCGTKSLDANISAKALPATLLSHSTPGGNLQIMHNNVHKKSQVGFSGTLPPLPKQNDNLPLQNENWGASSNPFTHTSSSTSIDAPIFPLVSINPSKQLELTNHHLSCITSASSSLTHNNLAISSHNAASTTTTAKANTTNFSSSCVTRWFPSKSHAQFCLTPNIMFRADVGIEGFEDLLPEETLPSYLFEEPRRQRAEYYRERVIYDEDYRKSLLTRIRKLSEDVEKVLNSSQCIEGLVVQSSQLIILNSWKPSCSI